MDKILDNTKAAIRELALANPNTEICGYVWPDGQIRAADNIHPDPSQGFLVEEDTHFAYLSQGAIAVYHTHYAESHPAYLSQDDLYSCRATQLPYILYHSGFDEWDLFDPTEVNPYPLKKPMGSLTQFESYQHIPFHWNRWDCFSVLTAYYKGMLGIQIADHLRPMDPAETLAAEWGEIDEHIESRGFVRLEKGAELKKHDIAIFGFERNDQKGHHFGVLVEPSRNAVLHCMSHDGASSSLMVFGGSWARRLRYWMRHKDVMA